MVAALLAALVFLLGIGGCLVLYVLVRDETNRRQVMNREEAERVARRDTDDVSDRR